MRLFIGINLPSELKDTLSIYRNTYDKGQPVAQNNYHITLVYLGETSDTKKEVVNRALKSLTPRLSPFTLTLSSLNTFKKGTTHIVYVEVIKTDALDRVQTAVQSLMTSLHFSLDTRPYTPHITLARKVKDLPHKVRVNATVNVHEITLFLSHRVDGELTYTPMATYPLNASDDDSTTL